MKSNKKQQPQMRECSKGIHGRDLTFVSMNGPYVRRVSERGKNSEDEVEKDLRSFYIKPCMVCAATFGGC